MCVCVCVSLHHIIYLTCAFTSHLASWFNTTLIIMLQLSHLSENVSCFRHLPLPLAPSLPLSIFLSLPLYLSISLPLPLSLPLYLSLSPYLILSLSFSPSHFLPHSLHLPVFVLSLPLSFFYPSPISLTLILSQLVFARSEPVTSGRRA